MSDERMWTSASWSNYYALNALLDVGFDLDDPVVELATDWFLAHQASSGAWMQVSAVHDTAMAILVLSRLLQAPLVHLAPAQVAVMRVSRENGGLRVDFHGCAPGTLIPSEKMKLSDSVREELAQRQQKVLQIIGRTRAPDTKPSPAPFKPIDTERELRRIGQYTFGHLIPATIQNLLHSETADHMRLDVDERVIDLPWELVHDGEEFLCLRFAAGRRLISDQAATSFRNKAQAAQDMSALVVANPTGDLPAAEREGERIADLLQNQCGVRVDFARRDELTKEDFLLSLRSYDIVHFAGHARRDSANPDESCLLLCDGEVQAFEIARFLQHPTVAVVFLNACWSAQEAQHWDSYSPVMRGLGRTFIYSGVGAFIGYLVPIPDESATQFAIEVYSNLAAGRSIGESVRRARLTGREKDVGDLTWASAVLYGDPAVRVFDPLKRS
ncbi:MAG: CHAT domain-containing protein [Thioalkalivibrio sp.]|nr:CHAT domain-containing protein [Thioalkalivibrio sp.]